MSRFYRIARYLPFVVLALALVAAHFGMHSNADPLLP